MSYSMRYVVTPSPVTDETLFEKLKGASSSRGNIQSTNNGGNNNNNDSVQTTTFDAIKSVPVSQITVGPAHIALLLEDGRVCRAPYQVLADRLDYPSAYPCQPSNQLISNSSLAPAHLVNTSSNNTGSNVSSNHTSHQPNQSHHYSHYLPHQHHQPPPSQQHQPLNSSSSTFPLLNSPKSSLSNVNLSSNNTNQIGVINPSSPPTLDIRANVPESVPHSSNPASSQQSAPTSNVPSFAGRVNIAPHVGSLSVQNRQVARRGRMLRQVATRGRATSVIMGSRTGLIAPQYVPEDLINQAQVVLQGKSRSVIVRELQRTNLDVNSAVNNLLSSDNEDPEDMDESQDYLPNDDLMSLLDSNVNLPGGATSVLIDAETVFPEDVFNSYSASRIRPTTIRHSVGSGRNQSDRESSLASELEMRRAVHRDQSRRWLEHALREAPVQDSSSGRSGHAVPTDFTLHQKNDSTQNNFKKIPGSGLESNPIQISDVVEIWPTTQDKKFVQIASLYSELIAISNTGQIHQWKWLDAQPFEGVRIGDVINYHSKVAQLNLTHERIQFLSASCIRATVVTETFKVATWIDDSIGLVGSKLEHSAQNFSEFQKGGKISQLQVCSLYSCVRLESGSMYWWGVAPFSQRKKNWKKMQSKSCKTGPSSGPGTSSEIMVGSVVCLKNGPSFGDGAIGFTTKDGIPKVGRLVMSAWNIDDTCTFKVIKPSDRKPQFMTNQQSSQPQQPIQETKLSIPTNSSSTTRARKMLGQPLDFSGNSVEEQLPSSPGLSKNSSSERLEMPPPPSPASSTCSEPGCSPSHKRKVKHLISGKDDDKYRDEEQWNLKDVTFMEEVKKPPVAKVIKLDGNTALVRFNQRDPYGQTDADVNSYLQDCRMIRKEELQLARETTSSCRIIDCQRSPKKLTISESVNFLTFTVSNNGIHAMVQNGSKVEYKIYQLASGRVSKSLMFPTDTNALLGRDVSLISLFACGESDVTVTLRDGNGSLYPLAKDHLDSIKEPQALDMAPVQALGMAIHPLKDTANPNRIVPTLVMAIALENQILIPAVLRSDPEYVRLTLASLDKEPVSQQIVASEKIDLNRNILHVAVYACAPSTARGCQDKSSHKPIDINDSVYQSGSNSSQTSTNYSAKPGSSEASVKRTRGQPAATKRGPSGAITKQQSSQINNSSDTQNDLDTESRSMSSLCDANSNMTPSIDTSILDWSNPIFCKLDVDPTEQKLAAHLVLMILIENPVLKPFMKDLMLQRDAHGMTPFMSAVSHRSYTAAIMLLELAHKIVTLNDSNDSAYRQKLFNMMIFPPNSHLDNNPLFMLCANDTCSFTWTGANHINQDIFECRTCGLTRTLCCCTECARTCHKGHDCRLKKTSPTAYCDCWEKCKCKSLVAGSQQMRYRLLERLLVETDLVTYPDSRGEMTLLFLVQTVGRQMMEQRQYGPDRSPRQNKRDEPPGMPDHDLSPPRFARKALHKMLSEWLALKSVIMAGTSSSQNLANTHRVNTLLSSEDQVVLSNQQGTAILDRFTHSVLIKIGPEMLDVLLATIILESSSVIPSRVNEVRIVAKRFVRSVARNGVVLSVELSPNNYSRPSSIMDWSSIFNHQNSSTHAYGPNSWKPSPPPGSVLQRCRKVFQALLPIAAEELAEIADALISPVRLGVPRPTASFSLVNSMAEATQGSEEIFVVKPVVLPSQSTTHDIPLVGPPTLQPVLNTTTNSDMVPEIPANGNVLADNPEPPVLSENNLSSSVPINAVLYDNEIAIDAMDSEDADASNNTFRPSNNGETDSESDSNADDASFQSNIDQSAIRSTTTIATIGSESGPNAGAYFSEQDSGDSSNPEEDDEESEANDTEQDTDDLALANEDSYPFSRRNVMNQSSSTSEHVNFQVQPTSRSTNLGQQLHWALRHRDHSFYPHNSSGSQAGTSSFPSTASRLASIGLANAYTYLDGAPPRRSVITSGSQPNSNAPSSCELSMSATSVGLARAFSIIIRSLSDLIPFLREAERSNSELTNNPFHVSSVEAANIISNLEKKMQPVWEWLFKVMDSTEGQLRFGCALTNGIQAANQSSNQPNQQNQYGAHQRGSSNHLHHHGNAHTSGIHHASSSSSSSGAYFSSAASQANPGGLSLNPAVLARVNPNPTAHNLNRRIPNLLDESSSRVHQSLAPIRLNDQMLNSDGSVRVHNSIGGNQPSVLGRPQSLSRPNFSGLRLVDHADGPNEVARRDFLSYMISLIRGHGNEHHDSLPILDVSSLRHVAYVFDAYVYFLQFLNRTETSKQSDNTSGLDNDQDSAPLTASSDQSRNGGSNLAFFRRSESTLFLNDYIPDPFGSPIGETLPLAIQPHLLQPHVRREELFGVTQRTELNMDNLPLQLGLSSSSSGIKISCPKCILIKQQHTTVTVASSANEQPASSGGNNGMDKIQHWPHCPYQRSSDHNSGCNQSSNDNEPRYNALLGRWRLTVELFGREFLDDVGAEPGSILIDLVGFPHKENRFRREMERLRNDTMAREISLTNVDRDHSTLIRQTIKELNYNYHLIDRIQNRRNHDLPILACSKVKVSFKDEKGEGNGVARSFYTAFCEAVLANEKLANLDMPLFYQPGIKNFYSPLQGDAQPERLNAFRNVGRIIGICLSQSEICPIQLNRHVIKYMLRRPIAWHDLAFFDPVLYESLRQLIVDAEQSQRDNIQSTLSTLDLRFCVDLCPEEGGGQVELAPGGADIEVNSENVYEYVRRYALKRMIKSQEKALQAMRQGIMDVLPASVMENLTAEDFRLLLNGVGEINVQTLINYTTFIDDRGTSAGKRTSVHIDEQLAYFKKWFWSIVEKMSVKERQDLVYFWTGTPAIPASDEGFQPMPTVSIRPAEDLHLPTSNVCIFRLYIPLYSSKTILRNKLLIAIKEKNFGFI